MGMFDSVKVRYALPEIDDPSCLDFQTKDMDCSLSVYEVKSDGRLWLDGEDTEYHGWLNIYTSLGELELGWLEFNLRFTDGVLDKVEVVEMPDGIDALVEYQRKEDPNES